MNDYIGIGILVTVLIISYLIARKDLKNWNEIDSVRKSLIIRALVGISAIIIILIYKIIKS